MLDQTHNMYLTVHAAANSASSYVHGHNLCFTHKICLNIKTTLPILSWKNQCLELGTYAQADDVTAEVELSLFNDMDGACLLLLYLNNE